MAVRGSIGVRLLPRSLSTYSVRRSYEGVTCCGNAPTGNCATIFNVRWLITSTVLLRLFGTYTSAGSPRTTGLRSPAASALYTLTGPRWRLSVLGGGLRAGVERERRRRAAPQGGSIRSRRAATRPTRKRGQFCGGRRRPAGRGFSARSRARRTSLPSRDPNPPNHAVRLSILGTRRGLRSDSLARIAAIGRPMLLAMLMAAPAASAWGAAPRRRRRSTAARPPRRRRARARRRSCTAPRYQLETPRKDPAFAVLGTGRFALVGGSVPQRFRAPGSRSPISMACCAP